MRDWLLRFFRPREWCRRENERLQLEWELDCWVAKQGHRPPPPPPNTVIIKP